MNLKRINEKRFLKSYKMQNELVREDSEIGNAIQIIEHENQAFELKLDVLKQILEVDALKDHHVSVVSIAGISRQGKSFLMNFFLKYLHAQVKNKQKSFVFNFVTLLYDDFM